MCIHEYCGGKNQGLLEVYEVDFIFCPQVPSPSVVMTSDESFGVYASRWLSQYLELYRYPRIYMHVHIRRHARAGMHTHVLRDGYPCMPVFLPPILPMFHLFMWKCR